MPYPHPTCEAEMPRNLYDRIIRIFSPWHQSHQCGRADVRMDPSSIYPTFYCDQHMPNEREILV